MYQQNLPSDVPQQPRPSNRTTIILIVLVALILIFLAAVIAGGLGYWIGSRLPADQAQAARNGNTSDPGTTPTPSSTPEATPTAAATPSPTPDIGGKYTGALGDVQITKVSDKSFNFNISVGNSNGVGQIDGQASRTSPTVGVYSKIPDMSLYNDPESSYYHKKCRLTFRFNAAKVSVSEDDYACNYWHGAAVDFSGTYNRKGK